MHMLNKSKPNRHQRIVIRVDASSRIGSGHIMRCLTLARRLQLQGAEVLFVVKELPGNYISFIEKSGFAVRIVQGGDEFDCSSDAKSTLSILSQQPARVDWLIVDHYAINECWEQLIRPFTKRIMVIDDLADRRHDCDLLLDQNLLRNMEHRYDNLVPEHCRLLLGPGYALLRSEFFAQRKNLKASRDGIIKRILVFFGGSDPTNETVKTLDALAALSLDTIQLDVVVGAANPYKDQVKKICLDLVNTNYHCQISNIAELMAKADLAIGAGGTSTWERCYLGLPTLICVVAQNQQDLTERVAELGAAINLGLAEDVQVEDIKLAVRWCLDNPAKVKQMSAKALELMGTSLSDDVIVRELLEA